MTLNSFIKITQRIANQMLIHNYLRPDAVCVSRKIFRELTEEVQNMMLALPVTDHEDAQICGLSLFVNDEMPDEYYQVGYKEDFKGNKAY